MIRHAPHRVPDICMQGSRANPHQHLVVSNCRLIDLPEVQDVG